MSRNFDVLFKWVGAATWILTVDGVKIACDPVLGAAGTVDKFRGRYAFKRLVEPAFAPSDFDGVDLWLITHGHEDHLDAAGAAMIAPGARIVTHRNALAGLGARRDGDVTVLATRESVRINAKGLSIDVEAMPAVHGQGFLMRRLMGGVNGYWLTVRKDDRVLQIYVTSDTVADPSVLAALEGRHADILIPNAGAVMQGTLVREITLSAAMLRQIIARVTPTHTWPVHHTSFSHYNSNPAQIRERCPKSRSGPQSRRV